MIGALARRLRRFRRSEDGGTSTVEFVILFPAFLAVFLSSFESGLMMVRNVMLERGVDIAVRELRIGMPIPPSYMEFRERICEEVIIFADCMDVVEVILVPIDTAAWDMPNDPTDCTYEGVDPVTLTPLETPNYDEGENNELMIVQVCGLFTPLFPGTIFGMQMPKFDPEDSADDAKYALVVTSAFVNEPSRSDDEET